MFLLCAPVRPLLVNLTHPYPVLSSVSDIPGSLWFSFCTIPGTIRWAHP